MKISVRVAPTLFQQTATTRTDDAVTVVMNVSSDKEGVDTVVTVRVAFTLEEWRALTPQAVVENKTLTPGS